MPSVNKYPNADHAPPLLTPSQSFKAARSRLVETILLGKNLRKIKTPLEPVVIGIKQLEHVVEKRKAGRERYINYVVPTLANPSEIWLTAYGDGFRRRFIKLFRGEKNMLVVVRENTDGSLFWNAIPAESKYIDKQRVGTLIYKDR